MDKELVTYGFEIQKEKFTPASHEERIEYLNKPKGGLWCSPKESEWSWEDWCRTNDFRVDKLNDLSTFKLKDSAKVLKIDSIFDFNVALKKYRKLQKLMGGIVLDWDKISKDYDVVYLTEQGNAQCHFPMDQMEDLNAWDCESLVILKWEAIDESTIKYIKKEKEKRS